MATTFEAIRDQLATAIKALTPATLSDRKYDRCPTRERLHAWAEKNASDVIFRRFEIAPSGAPEKVGLTSTTETLLQQDLAVTLSYPAEALNLYGQDNSDDMRDVVNADARQIRDLLFSGTNYPTDSEPTFEPVVELPEEGERVWFQTITVRVQRLETMNVT